MVNIYPEPCTDLVLWKVLLDLLMAKNELQTSHNILNGKTKRISRPINKLYRLEASESSEPAVRVIGE